MTRKKLRTACLNILFVFNLGSIFSLNAEGLFFEKNWTLNKASSAFFASDSLPEKVISFRKLLALEEEVVHFSIDTYGNFYYSDNSHTFREINLETGEKRIFSVKENINFIECRSGSRLYLFNQQEGKLLILNTLISDFLTYTFADGEYFPLIATPCDNDGNHIWFFDSRSFSIVKYFLFTQSVQMQFFTNNCSPTGDLIFFAEYKKKIFLLDKNENLCLWDNFGNFIRNEKASCEKIFFEENFYTYFDTSRACIVKKSYDGKLEKTVKLLEKNFTNERFFYSGDKWFMLRGKEIWKQAD
jgi:hypothetical protein